MLDLTRIIKIIQQVFFTGLRYNVEVTERTWFSVSAFPYFDNLILNAHINEFRDFPRISASHLCSIS